MQTTTKTIGRNSTMSAVQALLAAKQQSEKPATVSQEFWDKCDLLALSKDEAMGYIESQSSRYPVTPEDLVTDDIEVACSLIPSDRNAVKRMKLLNPTSDGKPRFRFTPKKGSTVIERIMDKADLGRVGVDAPIIVDGEIRKVYAGVNLNGQVFRVGTQFTTAKAIVAALPGATPVIVVAAPDTTDYEEA